MYGREEIESHLTHVNCSFFKCYLADEADAVMDAMEDRIKELEQTLTMASDPALHPTCADCEKCQPKWISVNDRLPEDFNNVLVYDEGSIYVAELENFDDGTKEWSTIWFSRSIEETYWMPLPPTTEEK